MQEMLQNFQSQAMDWLSTGGLQIATAIIILIVGRIGAGWVKALVKKALRKGSVDETLIPFLSGMAYFGAMAAVVVAALDQAGFQTTSLIAVFGAAGLAIALAFQGTVSNFASGVMLLVFRPISVGHFVDVGGTTGTVEKIDVFTTTMNTPDNVRIIVPNGQIFGQTIKNFSANENRRIDLVIGVGYDDDLGKAMQVITEVVNGDGRVLKEPEFVIAVNELADSSVNFVVRPWCKAEDYWALKWDLTKGIKEALDANGLSIPFPQRDVYVHQVDVA